MQSFFTLSSKFEEQFLQNRFPGEPSTLYEASDHIIKLAGKRVRPVCVLMGNELFNDLHPDAFHIANAVEMFHNFTLVHDDIMDKAPLRRGMPTVHSKYGESTALLAGDVILVEAYNHLNKITGDRLHSILSLFNKTAREVCEGQQLDMDFESRDSVQFEEYLHMITLKTSVLLAASLQMGAIIGGAGPGNQHHLYEFGKNLGIAFQVQDDYLDAFGDPAKFGKQVGGDILANKKTFLYLHALDVADNDQKKMLHDLSKTDPGNKVEQVLAIYKDCKVDEWAAALKESFFEKAMFHLGEIAVLSSRKSELASFAQYLLKREY